MFFEQHPLDLDLVAFFDSPNQGTGRSIATHIRDCRVCTNRLHQIAPDSFQFQQSEGDAVVVKSLASISPEDGSSRSLASRISNDTVAEPLPGQLWRLHWEDVTHLALIASTTYGNLTIWPVTLDVEFTDESALLVPASDSGIDLKIAIWPAIETGIGAYVLERYITDVLSPELLRDLRRAYRTGGELPVQWLPGNATAGAESPRGGFRADLVQVATFLGEATWEPEVWANSELAESMSLSEALSAAGITATQLASELEISDRRAISLRRGLAEPTPQELDKIHDCFGVSLSGQVGLPPQEVIEALNNPLGRDLILRAAAAEGKSEVSLRRELAQMHLALAARRSRSSGDATFEMLKTEIRKRIAAAQKSKE